MTRNSIKIYTILICGLALISACGLVTTTLSSDLDFFYKLEAICDVIALIFAFIYFILGFKKDFASYHKIAMYFAAANALIVTVVSSNETNKYIAIAMCAVCFALVLILALAKNLGKTVSLILCAIIILIRFSGVLSYYLTVNTIDVTLTLMVSQLVLALVILVATLAKYEDKQERHAK